ncbi:hypothetical protein FK514_29415, partial [Klebsiella pneumoniae]|uniref:hypothetical protein n=1 Tax=Klebsiella pneumoniae TaxID=573 RepID=UPI00210BC2A3
QNSRSSMPIIELKLTGPANQRDAMLALWPAAYGAQTAAAERFKVGHRHIAVLPLRYRVPCRQAITGDILQLFHYIRGRNEVGKCRNRNTIPPS